MSCCSKGTQSIETVTNCCSNDLQEVSPLNEKNKVEAQNSSSCCGKSEEEDGESVDASCCDKTTENVETDKSSCCNGEEEQLSDSVEEGQVASCCSNEVNLVEEKSSCCSSSVNQVEIKSTCCGSEVEKEMTSCSNGVNIENDSCCAVETKDLNKQNESLLQKAKTEFTIHGMDCPSCATSIEKNLKRLKGISEAEVNYSSEKLRITTTEGFSESELNKTIHNLGFTMDAAAQVNNHAFTYKVDGMDCGGCANSIVKHLMNIPGVNDVQVSFATGKMKAAHTIPVEKIINEVGKIGFQASLEEEQSGQKKSVAKSGIPLIALSGILIATGFIGSYLGLPSFVATILYAIALISSGYKPIKSAYYSLRSRSLDMNVLMSSAAIGAAIIGEWFEGATVVWLFSFGVYLQNRSMDQTRKSIRTLMNLAPSMAWVPGENGLVQKPVEEILKGQIIVVKPGDKIPLDGNIQKGESSINQAPITGESLPVDKGVGEVVYAGTINESGSLEIVVTKLVEDTTLAKIIHLVEEAQEQKSPTEAFIDRFASIYTPIVFILALAVIVLPPLFGFGNWGEWAYKGLALLVVACPCALVISTPVAIVSAIGNAAKNGVLIKGGTFLETIGAINAVAFDKTGTLTEGKPKVSEIYSPMISEEQLLSIAYTLESHSSHPIAKALVEHAKEKAVPFVPADNHRNIVGKGVQATIDGVQYYAGSPRLFEGINVSIEKIADSIHKMEQQGKSIIVIGNEQKVLGVIAVSDTIRSTTIATLESLKEVGIKEVVMLTGDNATTAKSIAAQTGVSRYFAELLPEDKVSALKDIQNEHLKVAMVGDGINDAPALATADLGIAMGVTGTDTAMETADVVLMADNLDKLPYTVKLSRKTMAIIKQNIWFSLIIKFAALALIFPGWLTLWMAVLSDTGAAIIVILNALRLLRVKD